MNIDALPEMTLDAGLQPAKMRDRTPADIEKQIMRVGDRSSRDEMCAALDAAEWLLSRARTIDQLIKQITIAWIDRNGEFDIGDNHFSVGYATTAKCLDVPQTGHAVLEAAGGDVDQLLRVLVAQPYKHGTVRSFLDQRRYASLFRVMRTGRLIAGVPERVLKRADERFCLGPLATLPCDHHPHRQRVENE